MPSPSPFPYGPPQTHPCAILQQCETSASAPRGRAARARWAAAPFRISDPRAHPLLCRALGMRSLIGITLLALALAPDVRAHGLPCGRDVGGRSVPCACGDVLVSSHALSA